MTDVIAMDDRYNEKEILKLAAAVDELRTSHSSRDSFFFRREPS